MKFFDKIRKNKKNEMENVGDVFAGSVGDIVNKNYKPNNIFSRWGWYVVFFFLLEVGAQIYGSLGSREIATIVFVALFMLEVFLAIWFSVYFFIKKERSIWTSFYEMSLALFATSFLSALTNFILGPELWKIYNLILGPMYLIVLAGLASLIIMTIIRIFTLRRI